MIWRDVAELRIAADSETPRRKALGIYTLNE